MAMDVPDNFPAVPLSNGPMQVSPGILAAPKAQHPANCPNCQTGPAMPVAADDNE